MKFADQQWWTHLYLRFWFCKRSLLTNDITFWCKCTVTVPVLKGKRMCTLCHISGLHPVAVQL